MPNIGKSVLAGILLALIWAGEASAQRLGPYWMEFRVGGNRMLTNEVFLVRREKDMLWVGTADLRRGETGVAIADIRRIHVPRPEVLELAEQLLGAPVPVEEVPRLRYHERMKQVLERLDRETKMFAPYRSLPGIPDADLVFMRGRLLEREGKWDEALKVYESLLDYLRPEDPAAVAAQIHAGIVYARQTNFYTAIEYLAPLAPPEDDERLLSDMAFALGDAYAALGNYDSALLAYLQLLVFHPFVYNNEPRVLEKVLPCYAALGEWEPMLRTLRWIMRDYPGSPAEKTADEYFATYAAQLGAAHEFVDAVEPDDE